MRKSKCLGSRLDNADMWAEGFGFRAMICLIRRIADRRNFAATCLSWLAVAVSVNAALKRCLSRGCELVKRSDINIDIIGIVYSRTKGIKGRLSTIMVI